MGMTKEDSVKEQEIEKLNIQVDINTLVQEQVKEILTSEYHWIKMEDEQIRLFKSLSNRRLDELGETFGEYKVRQKINNKMVKIQKKGIYERSN